MLLNSDRVVHGAILIIWNQFEKSTFSDTRENKSRQEIPIIFLLIARLMPDYCSLFFIRCCIIIWLCDSNLDQSWLFYAFLRASYGRD